MFLIWFNRSRYHHRVERSRLHSNAYLDRLYRTEGREITRSNRCCRIFRVVITSFCHTILPILSWRLPVVSCFNASRNLNVASKWCKAEYWNFNWCIGSSCDQSCGVQQAIWVTSKDQASSWYCCGGRTGEEHVFAGSDAHLHCDRLLLWRFVYQAIQVVTTKCQACWASCWTRGA